MPGVDGAPAGLGGLDQLEGHGQAGRAGAGPLGDPGAVAHGGERGLDRVGRAQVDPVLGGIVVERQQKLQIVSDLGGLGELRAVGGGEHLRRGRGVGLALGVADLRQRLLRAGRRGLGQRRQDVPGLVPPAALLLDHEEDLAQHPRTPARRRRRPARRPHATPPAVA